jgi:methylmalonyl-CoA mutase N-terminal domain/subunit
MRGLDVDALGRRVSFFFNAHNDFIEEIAKYRAARRLWAGIMRDRFKSRDPRSQQLRFHTQTAGSTLTAQQPHNNVVRVTLQAMAALLGGTQSLHTNAKDEALALPSEEAAKLALRTQQILAHETGICDVADPFGGSFQIEEETDRLEAEAAKYIETIDGLGGAAAALDYERTEIEKSALAVQREIEEGRRVIVGVNKYEEPGNGSGLKVLKVDEKTQAARRDAFERRKASRSRTAVDAALSALRAAADREVNLFPAVLDCVKAEATLGEICTALVERYGRHTQGRPLS